VIATLSLKRISASAINRKVGSFAVALTPSCGDARALQKDWEGAWPKRTSLSTEDASDEQEVVFAVPGESCFPFSFACLTG
jgi:hypothetical protein